MDSADPGGLWDSADPVVLWDSADPGGLWDSADPVVLWDSTDPVALWVMGASGLLYWDSAETSCKTKNNKTKDVLLQRIA